MPHRANSNPATPPRTDNRVLSVSVFRMSRPRPAPSAARITNSWRPATARTISKLAKFAHAISSTRPTAPKSTSNADRTSPTSHSCSGTNCLLRSFSSAGYCSASRRSSAAISLCACASVTPAFNRQ